MIEQYQIEQFREEGYTIVDCLNKNKLAHCASSLAGLIASSIKKNANVYEKILNNFSAHHLEDQDWLLHQGMLQLEKENHRYLSEIYNTLPKCTSFLQVITDEKIVEAVNQILGRSSDSNLYMDPTGARMDFPGESAYSYGWHKDRDSNIPGSRFVQMWAPLITDLPNDRGGLYILPKSHLAEMNTNQSQVQRESVLDTVDIREPLRAPVSSELNFQGLQPIYPELRLGQALLFQPEMMHKSGINLEENTMRYCVITMYHDTSYSGFHYVNLSAKN